MTYFSYNIHVTTCETELIYYW